MSDDEQQYYGGGDDGQGYDDGQYGGGDDGAYGGDDQQGYDDGGNYDEGGDYGGDGQDYDNGEQYEEPEPQEEEEHQEEEVEENHEGEDERQEEDVYPEDDYNDQNEDEHEEQEEHEEEHEEEQPDEEAHAQDVDDVEVLDWSPEDVSSPEDLERLELSGHTLQATDSGDGGGFNVGSMIKGAMDGFGGESGGGGGGFGSIVGTISSMISVGGGSPLSNTFSSGGFSHIAEGLIAKAAHRFLGIDERTGAIIGAIAGNAMFGMGGQGNSLGGLGKLILDNIVSGKFRRKVDPWVSPVAGMPKFNLNFYAERDRCLQSATLFEDPEFPAGDRALFYKTPPDQEVVWKRPGEIVSNPQLIVEGHSRFDVKQGALGDCWLLAAVANLTLRDELFYRVCPPDQSFTDNYAGIFHFQFWRYGKWVDVVIDDRLPTVDSELMYMHSADHNEFWSALLEKAYAKVYGSYEALEGGSTVEALEDFTGGLTENFDLRKTPRETILAMMVRGFQMGGMFGCSIAADPEVKEAVRRDGLVMGHAYSITALHTVQTSHGEVVLVRIRNPWGNSKEWNGAWSDNAPEWDQVDASARPPFEKDGEFWMSFDDFYREFEEMELCNLSAQVMNEINEMTGVDTSQIDKRVSQWAERANDGQWDEQRGTAGGCSNYPNSYYRNPQFGAQFTVTADSVEQDGKVTVIVALLQKYRRELQPQGLDTLPIGFSVYEAPTVGTPLDMHYLRNNKAIARVPVYVNMREVTVRFRVPPGDFVILPSTFEPGQAAEFLIRIYANGALQFGTLQG
ncbi:unnamed protein product, partial [Mesorhabditis spiculigera]